MTKKIGSQTRDTLKESGYTLIKRINKNNVILQEKGESHCESWFKNDHHAGYVIEINGLGYEYTRRVDCPKKGGK